MAERVLTQRELNRALLARQLLLERGRMSVPKALERIGGIQAQYAPSMYVGLWSRVDGFDRDALDRALARRSVVQGTLMRLTIHLVSARDWWPFAVATREARRRSWLRYPGHPDARTAAAAARKVRRLIANGPMQRKDIEAAVNIERSAIYGVGCWLDMVRVPPSGTWARRRADVFAAAEDWLGPEEAEPADALDHAVSSYLRGFGPAARPEIADYLGLGLRDLDPALERIKLRRFQDESGKELLDLPRAPLPDADTPAPVRFLPTWDATLLAHARRTGILPEEYRPRVFGTKTPQTVSTFLVDGTVAGTWRYEKGRIKLSRFGRLDKGARRALDEEAERLAALHSDE
ncbi:MAG: winged helix DNA-binding domain-containing protein [Thermoleophilaceae bacterium]